MNKPKCCMCSTDIKANEHYFIIRGRSVCKECEVRIRPLFKEAGTRIDRSRNEQHIRKGCI